MSKMKWLSIAVIGLLVTNLVIVSTILFKKEAPASIPQQPMQPGTERPGGPKFYIMEKLQFDEAQKAAYEKLVLNHRNSIDAKEAAIEQLKSKLYATLADDTLTPQKDSLEAALAAVQKQIEEIHYNHFMEIKQLCKPQQLPLYNELSKEFARFFMPPKRPPHPPQP
jgi:periplasmic protein CpxP/Spy